jgi:hypothetical protein
LPIATNCTKPCLTIEELTMKRMVSLAVVPLVFGIATATRPGGRDRDVNQDARGRLVGAWRLVSLEETGADGKLHRCDCTGMFVFTRDGHASVQVMMRDSQPAAPAGPVQYSQGGYEASFGRYTLDERAHAFTFSVEGALVRSLIGKDLVRPYELSGNRLVVRPSSPDEHWRVTWERY